MYGKLFPNFHFAISLPKLMFPVIYTYKLFYLKQAVDESDSFTMECSFDSEVQACVWTHHEPMNEGESEDYDIICSGGPSSDGDNCETANGGSRY